MAAKTIKVKCEVCPQMFVAKVADRERGWAKCCSKSCAARKREKKTGNYARHISMGQDRRQGISVYPTYESDYKD